MGLSLPKDILLKIDHERGDIPRSRYILRILEKVYLNTGTNDHVKINDLADMKCSNSTLTKARSPKELEQEP